MGALAFCPTTLKEADIPTTELTTSIQEVMDKQSGPSIKTKPRTSKKRCEAIPWGHHRKGQVPLMGTGQGCLFPVRKNSNPLQKLQLFILVIVCIYRVCACACVCACVRVCVHGEDVQGQEGTPLGLKSSMLGNKNTGEGLMNCIYCVVVRRTSTTGRPRRRAGERVRPSNSCR